MDFRACAKWRIRNDESELLPVIGQNFAQALPSGHGFASGTPERSGRRH